MRNTARPLTAPAPAVLARRARRAQPLATRRRATVEPVTSGPRRRPRRTKYESVVRCRTSAVSARFAPEFTAGLVLRPPRPGSRRSRAGFPCRATAPAGGARRPTRPPRAGLRPRGAARRRARRGSRSARPDPSRPAPGDGRRPSPRPSRPPGRPARARSRPCRRRAAARPRPTSARRRGRARASAARAVATDSARSAGPSRSQHASSPGCRSPRTSSRSAASSGAARNDPKKRCGEMSRPGHREDEPVRGDRGTAGTGGRQVWVRNTSRNSTRIPYGRNRYHPGSHACGSTRSMSAAPSSGGIGRKLKIPRNRLTSANSNGISTRQREVGR